MVTTYFSLRRNLLTTPGRINHRIGARSRSDIIGYIYDLVESYDRGFFYSPIYQGSENIPSLLENRTFWLAILPSDVLSKCPYGDDGLLADLLRDESRIYHPDYYEYFISRRKSVAEGVRQKYLRERSLV